MPGPATATVSVPGQPAAAAVAVVRRLPGKARPREDVLREYRDLNAERRSRVAAPLWSFWAPDPDKYYRWRVRLDCDCVTEAMTWGPDSRPDDAQWLTSSAARGCRRV